MLDCARHPLMLKIQIDTAKPRSLACVLLTNTKNHSKLFFVREASVYRNFFFNFIFKNLDKWKKINKKSEIHNAYFCIERRLLKSKRSNIISNPFWNYCLLVFYKSFLYMFDRKAQMWQSLNWFRKVKQNKP